MPQRQKRQTVIIGGPANRTPEEEEMVGRARRTRNPRAALEAMKKERQQKQLDEQKEQQSRAEFGQDKKKMLGQLKGGSNGGGLNLKGGETKLALKSGNVTAANQGDAIKDIRNSAYWALKAANATDYKIAKVYGERSARTYKEYQAELPSVPYVPSPVRADPQERLYQFLIKEVGQTTSELKVIDTTLKQAKEKKRKSEEKIDLQKIKIEELKQKTEESKHKAEELKQKIEERKKEDKQKEVDALIAKAQALQKEQEETDDLIAAALAAEDEAIEEVKEASKNLVSLNEQQKEKEENLNNLRQGFDTAEKHPERAENILEKLEVDK